MSDNNNGQDGKDGWITLIREAKEGAFHARRKLRRELPDPSIETKRDVVAATADYYDILEDYADERAIDGEWGERVSFDPNALLGETTRIEQQTSRWDRSSGTGADVPMAASVQPAQLLQLGKELDAIAKELGFAAKADERTPLAADVPQLLPEHIKEQAPAYQEARSDGGEPE